MRCPGCVCVALWFLAGGVSCLADSTRTPRAFEAGDSLETIREKIADNGYSFEVGHTWVYDLPPAQREALHGRHASFSATAESDDIGPIEKHLSKSLPTSFDWRSRNGHAYIGSVRNQGNCGSCYAFGAAAAAEGTYNVALGIYDGDCADFSEAFIAWCLGGLSQYSGYFHGCDGATYDYMELQALTQQGICSEAVFPYADTDSQSCPSSAWSAPKAVFSEWHRITCGDIEAIKTAVMTYGVVDASVYAGDAFDAYTSGVYDDTNTTCNASNCYYADTNHSVSLVGWDDNPAEGGEGCWILRNSWGTSWGENGYMRIRYASAHVACEACYLVYGGSPLPTATPTAPSGPTPTPTPALALALNADSITEGGLLTVDATVQVIKKTVDAWGVVFGPDGAVYSFNPGTPSSLRSGAVPLVTDLAGFWGPASFRLLEMTVPTGVQGEYRIVAGLVTAGIDPTGPESAIPGYVDQKTVTIR